MRFSCIAASAARPADMTYPRSMQGPGVMCCEVFVVTDLLSCLVTIVAPGHAEGKRHFPERRLYIAVQTLANRKCSTRVRTQIHWASYAPETMKICG